jgi:hypothetical protein
MDNLIETLIVFRSLIYRVAEIGVGLLAVIVIFYLLLGENSGEYVTSVIANLSTFIDLVKPETAIAVAILAAAYYIFRRIK